MREVYLLALLALAAIGFAGYYSTRIRRVLLVGDSLAVGLAGPLGTRAAAGQLVFHAAAKESTFAPYWDQRISALLAEHHPDLVIVSLGTNDCASLHSLACDAYPAAAASIISRAREARARVVWLIPSWLDHGDPDGHAGRIWEGLPDKTQRLMCNWPKLQNDGIHPTPQGYRTWAADIAARLF